MLAGTTGGGILGGGMGLTTDVLFRIMQERDELKRKLKESVRQNSLFDNSNIESSPREIGPEPRSKYLYPTKTFSYPGYKFK